MNRRDLLKKGLFSLGVIALSQVASSLGAYAANVVKAAPGKLGYRDVSKFPHKNCENCKHFKAESSECVLISMRKQMKADQVLVDKAGHCNMWIAIK